MVRTFVSFDGEVIGEEEWNPSPILKCFFCDTPTTYWDLSPECECSQHGEHQLVTLCNR